MTWSEGGAAFIRCFVRSPDLTKNDPKDDGAARQLMTILDYFNSNDKNRKGS